MLSSLWGKLGGAGLGFVIGGPLGALIGAAAGHVLVDAEGAPFGRPDPQLIFTTGLIALSAKMARSDGVVTGDEVATFRQLIQAEGEDLARIQRLFDLARQTTAGYEAYAGQLADLLSDQPQLLEDILDALFDIAAADGVLHEAERRYLSAVAAIFGFAERYEQIEARHVAGAGDPWRVLGVSRDADAAALKAAWIALVQRHHPDRAIARGLPPEAIAVANRRIAAINAAYEAAKKLVRESPMQARKAG